MILLVNSGCCAGLPSAIGAKIVRPDQTVVAVVGDGGFMMNSQVGHCLGLCLGFMAYCSTGYNQNPKF